MTRARDLANLIGSGNFTTETLTATAGQTAFTPSNTFTSNFLQVFYNGLLLDPTVDYTENGTTITLTVAATAGDEMEVVTYNTFSVGDAITQTEADVRYVNASGDTMSGGLTVTKDNANGQSIVARRGDGNWTEVGVYSGASDDVKAQVQANSLNSVVRIGARTSHPVEFTSGDITRMAIDTSGNLLVGKTSANSDTAGFEANASGFTAATRSNGTVFVMDRLTSDGEILSFRKDNTTVGSIGNSHSSGHIGIFSPSSGIGCYSSGIYPINGAGNASDNSKDLGALSVRWDDVYATNGTIQTSDRNEKQDIAELDEAEKRVAVAAKGLIRKYRWKDAVAEKGDDARIHVGIIAQDLQAAFVAEGLDAGRYAMFISSTWWEADEVIPAVDEVLDDEGNVVTEAQPERTVTHHYETAEEAPEGATERTRLGVRYPELLAFIIGAM